MVKVIICLALTLIFSFLSVQSFMGNDYGRLKRWLAYYQEYKAFDEAVRRGDASSAEMLDHLKTLYPGQIDTLEAQLKEKYGNVAETAKEKQSFLSDTLDDTWNTLSSDDEEKPAEEPKKQAAPNSRAEAKTPQRQAAPQENGGRRAARPASDADHSPR